MPLLSILVTLVVLCIVFSLMYWIITLVGNVLPPPMKRPITTLLFVLLALIAIGCLLDLVGVFGSKHVLIPFR